MPPSSTPPPRITPARGSNVYVEQAPGETLTLFVNGELVAEIVARKADTVVDWQCELAQARSLNALPAILASFAARLGTIHNREDHAHPKPEGKIAAYVAGFADGLQGLDVPHPANNDFRGLNLRVMRDNSACFAEGYGVGEAVRNVLAKLKRKE